MSDHDSLRHVRLTEDAMQKAQAGDANMERFLRMRIEHAAKRAPLDVIIQLTQLMLDRRKQELNDEAEAN